MDDCGNAAALSRHYFFPCPLEFHYHGDEIQRPGHVFRSSTENFSSRKIQNFVFAEMEIGNA